MIIEGNGIMEFDIDMILGWLIGGGFLGMGMFDVLMLVVDIGGFGLLWVKINWFWIWNMFVSELSVLFGIFVWYGFGSDFG